MTTSFPEMIANLPKAELHVHLRGAIPREVLSELAAKYDPAEVWAGLGLSHKALYEKFANIREFVSDSGNPEILFKFESIRNFLLTYGFTRHFFREIDDFRLLVRGVIEFLKGQKIVYAEVTVSLIEYVDMGLLPEQLVECLDEEAESAEGIKVRWIVDLVRNFGVDPGVEILRGVIGLKPRTIVGITLGGSEDYCHPSQYAKAYEYARKAGLRTSVHAGEALGAESVWNSLEHLKPDRIGHGVRSSEDETLMWNLAQLKIPLEVCPTSNVFLQVYPSHEELPIRRLHDAGVKISINSDDPAFFGSSLNDELVKLHETGFSQDEVLGFIRESFMSSFLPDTQKANYLMLLDDERERLSGQS